MDMKQYAGSSFLRVADIEASGPRQVAIADISEGKFGKPDLTFDDGSMMGLNATNTRTLINAYGADSNRWIKKRVELVTGSVEYQGAPKETILIRPISPPLPKKAPAPPPDMNDTVPF